MSGLTSKLPSNPSTSSSNTLKCAVCSSTRGTALFYGGLVCGGCKVFFLRAVTSKAQYNCQGGTGNCNILSDGWVKCRACRFQKCLDAKMNPKGVGVMRDGRPPKAPPIKEPDSPPSIDMPTISTELSKLLPTSVPQLSNYPNYSFANLPAVQTLLPLDPSLNQTPVAELLSLATSLGQIPNLNLSQSILDSLKQSQNILAPTSSFTFGAVNAPQTSGTFMTTFTSVAEAQSSSEASTSTSEPILHLPFPDPESVTPTMTKMDLQWNSMSDYLPKLPIDFSNVMKGFFPLPVFYPPPLNEATVTPRNEIATNSEGTNIERDPVVSYTIPRHTELMSSSYLIGLDFLRRIQKEGGGATSIAKQLWRLETMCDVAETTANNFEFRHNLETSLSDAIQNPLMLCDRTPMGWRDVRLVKSSMMDTIRALYCRIALHYLDWVSGLSEVHALSEQDRNSLVSSQMCQMELTTMMFNTYKANVSEGLLFSSGYKFIAPADNREEFDTFCHNLATYMHREVIKQYREMNLTDEEYVLMKIIGFFSASTNLSDDGLVVVRRARQKYEQVLIEYIKETLPNLPREEQGMRVYRIVSLNKHGVYLAQADNAYLSRMFALNIGNMQGQIIYDMHLRNY